MIPIYIGSSDRFSVCESAIAQSIAKNTDSPVRVKIIRPEYIGMQETGCTGFTNVRFAIPELLRKDGYEYGIYLDVDMIVLSDIAELYEYKKAGKYVCIKDGSTEVAVISSYVQMPSIIQLSHMNKSDLLRALPISKDIPISWNVEDTITPEANLIHFTDLKRQPWFYDNHPCPAACKVWREYANH